MVEQIISKLLLKKMYINMKSLILVILFFIPISMVAQIIPTASGLATFSLSTPPAPLIDYTNNLNMWLKFNEGSGTTAIDYSTNSNTATLIGTPIGSTFEPGDFFFNDFSGDTVIFSSANSATLNPSTAITISFFLKSPINTDGSGGPGGICGKGYFSQVYVIGSTTNIGIQLYTVESGPSGFSLFTVNQNFYDDQWHHIVCTWDGAGDGLIRIFKDGVQVAISSSPNTGTLASNSDPFVVGDVNQYNQHKLYGRIKHMREYRESVTQVNVQKIYNYLK